MGPGSDQSELPNPIPMINTYSARVLTLTAELFGRSLVAQGKAWGLRRAPVLRNTGDAHKEGTPDIVSYFILMQIF